MKSIYIQKAIIERWIIEALTKLKIDGLSSRTIADRLVQTSLWGIDSHGVLRIPHYLKRFNNGTLNLNPNLTFTQTGGGTGTLDGDDGHGILVMTEATKYAIELANQVGVGVVGAYNSSHCGAIGLYTRQITQSNMVGLSFTHSDSLVIPFGGQKPFFGTNPISIAFPTSNKERPICLDMATSIIPWNTVINARIENKEIPSGLAVDINGDETTNPHKIVAVKPIVDYKGYGLAFMIDMFCSVLNGVNYGPNMTSMYKDIDKKRKLGSTVIAIDPKRFGGKDSFKIVADEIIHQIKLLNQSTLFPGEPEYMTYEERIKLGIPFSKAERLEFDIWSEKLNIFRLE